MATNQEALEQIKQYLNESYNRSITYSVPKKNDLTFGNTVKKIEHAKIFYIDMRKSRKILTDATDFWSVKIHKSFLRAVIHCIEKRDGHLRSFNGDGILAFFVGDNAASKAVRAAMEIKGFVNEINTILVKNNKNKIDFGIGIAQGPIMVAKSGKAGDDQTKQDLIWIGIALYVAVELSELAKSPKNIWISDHVFNSVNKEGDPLNTLKHNNEWIWYYEYKTLNNGYQKVHHTTWYFNV
ncbi:adenylate/guanylate cyclase domain-containing protein [bacterium]|nr:adenylate/guanylate cyclase domain-containing protein [bacterium]